VLAAIHDPDSVRNVLGALRLAAGVTVLAAPADAGVAE
jgi:hypothetical protein